MIIQSNDQDFPRQVDKVLFVLGLLIYTLGQILLNLGQDFVSSQQPIDFAHWMLLVGALLLLPFAGRLPRRNIHVITIPVFLAGVAAVIGMCVLDFIFWSLPPGELEQAIVRHLVDTPAIWQVFIVIGPSWVFITGLALLSLSYFNVSRIGTGLVLLGTILMIFTGRDWIVQNYLIVTAGYFLCFNRLRLF